MIKQYSKDFTDYEWFIKTDLSKYSGKWVAILDKKIVASSENIEQLMKETKNKFFKEKPLITKIK